MFMPESMVHAVGQGNPWPTGGLPGISLAPGAEQIIYFYMHLFSRVVQARGYDYHVVKLRLTVGRDLSHHTRKVHR